VDNSKLPALELFPVTRGKHGVHGVEALLVGQEEPHCQVGMFRLSGVLVLPSRRQVPGGDVALVGQLVELLIQFLQIHGFFHGCLLR